jgi:hypothetical protein
MRLEDDLADRLKQFEVLSNRISSVLHVIPQPIPPLTPSSLSLSLSLSLSFSLSLSLTHTHAHAHMHTLTHASVHSLAHQLILNMNLSLLCIPFCDRQTTSPSAPFDFFISCRFSILHLSPSLWHARTHANTQSHARRPLTPMHTYIPPTFHKIPTHPPPALALLQVIPSHSGPATEGRVGGGKRRCRQVCFDEVIAYSNHVSFTTNCGIRWFNDEGR